MSEPDLNGNKGPFIIGISIFLMVISTVAVVLRFLSRKLSGAGFWWDDWMCIIALPWIFGCNICNIYPVRYGFGRHAAVLPLDATSNVLRLSFSFEILYTVTTGLVKYSILLFYKRLFPQRSVRITLWTIGAIILSWQVASLFAFFFQCQPLHKAWDFTAPGKCIDVSKVWIGNGVTNIITDLILIALPMPLIWNLQITKTQKVALSGVFLTGAFVCAVSFIRLANLITVSPTDIPWNYVGIGIWSAVEPSIGLVSACLPSMRFLLKLITQSCSKSASGSTPLGHENSCSAQKPHPGLKRPMWSDETGSFRRLNEDNAGLAGYKIDVTKNDLGVERMEGGVPLNAIHVKNEVELTDNRDGF